MNTRIYQKGFAGGEIAPEMFGRIDDTKFQSGAAKISNFLVKPQGVLLKRPGFEFLASTKRDVNDSRTTRSRLIPFQFSVDEAVVLEIRAWDGVPQAGNYGTIRFHDASGLVQHAAPTFYIPGTTVTFSNVGGQLRVSSASWTGVGINTPPFAQSDTVCFRNTGGSLPPQLAANTIYYVDYDIPTAGTGFFLKTSPTGSRIAFTSAGSGTNTIDKFYDIGSVVTSGGVNYLATAPVYSSAGLGLITSPSTDALWFQQFTTALELKHFYLDSEIFQLTYTQSFDVLTLAHPNHPVRELKRFGTNAWTLTPSLFNTTPQVAGLVATSQYGMAWRFDWVTSQDVVSGQDKHWATLVGPTQHLFAKGDLVYCKAPYYSLIDNQFFNIAQDSNVAAQIQTTIPANNANWLGTRLQTALVEDTAYIQRALDSGYYYVRINATRRLAANIYPFQLTATAYENESWWQDGTALRVCDTSNAPVVAINGVGYLQLDPSFASTKRFNLLREDGTSLYGQGTIASDVLVALAVCINGRRVSTTSEAYGHYRPLDDYPDRCGLLQQVTSIQDATNSYCVTAVVDNIEGPASATVTVLNNLLALGSKNTLSWAAVAGATSYNVYKEVSGLFGYIGRSDSTSFTDDNITPDFSQTPPYIATVFNAAGLYPGAVAYFDQRKCFAGALDEPNKLYMSKPFTESEFSYRLPSNDTDRIEVEIAAREANRIRHIVPLGELLLMSNSSEWRVSPINSEALTPSTISVRPQSYIGANSVQPVVVNNSAIFCAARGGHVREMGFNFQAQGFVTGDLSLRAPHLFDEYELTDLAYQKAPYPVLWFVSSSGKLLGLTYVPEERVGAWHQHDLGGDVESVCVIPQGTEDRLYVVVKRTIDGQTLRTVERMGLINPQGPVEVIYGDGAVVQQKKGSYTKFSVGGFDNIGVTFAGHGFSLGDLVAVQAESLTGPIFVGAVTSSTTNVFEISVLTNSWGLNYTNIATSGDVYIGIESVSGLDHLEGETVDVVADGIVLENLTVVDGEVKLVQPRPLAATVVVGKTPLSELVSIPAAMQMDAFGQGRAKNVNKAWMKVTASSKATIGPNGDVLVPASKTTLASTTEMQEIDVTLLGSWKQSGQVTLRHDLPLPLVITGITYEVAIGG